MLFRKKIERSCTYCRFGTELGDGSILCSKKGVRPPDKPCRAFQYDPTRRIPLKQNVLDFSKYDNDDFSL